MAINTFYNRCLSLFVMFGINTEMITGIALVLLAILFMIGAVFFKPWETILIVDYVLVAIGAAFIALGVWTRRNSKKEQTEEPSHH
jgi:putative Ca2+/H+ antiporter (TMEM165/GDT1 family)